MSENIIEQSFWEKVKRFLSPFGRNPGLYMLANFTYFVSAINIIVYIVFVERVLGILESGTSAEFYNTIYMFIYYYIGYILLKITLRMKGWPAHATTAKKYVQGLYLPKFFRLDNNEIEKLGTGKIIAILDKGITIWANLFHHFFEEGTRILVSVIFTAYMVGRNSSVLLGIFVFLCLVMYISSFFFNKGTLRYRRKRRDWGNTHTKQLVRLIMSKNEVLFTNKGTMEINKLDSYCDKETYYNKRMANFLMPMFELPRMIITGLLIFVLYYFGGQYLEGSLQISQIVGLSTAFIVMFNTISSGIQFFKNFTKEFTDIEKLWDFFDTTPLIEGYEKGNTFQYKNGKIELKNLSYGYTPENLIFKDFSLNISGNQVTALVGPSGGGKSTLVKLISGYIRQDSGYIIVDNQSLTETSLKSYYKDIGYLTQEPSVFDGSVRENLEYGISGRDNLSEGVSFRAGIVSTELESIISLAHCDFIYDLPDGLDTEIGERGVKLSGGQKQRLAIAKIFLKDPKIIILDEPTSALDSLSEKKITQAMHNLFRLRTVIIIAHRLQTVKHADNIIVIDGGKVIEQGTHSQLVKKKGFYKEMLDLQSGF